MRNYKCEIADVRGLSRETTSRTAQVRLRNSMRIVDSRLGFTLIELLIAIAIIATLSALFLGASRSAMEFARASRTKTTISKLHTLLMEQWASYETRPVDINKAISDDIELRFKNGTINASQRGNELAVASLNAKRELMKMEMPDRWSDVTGNRFGAPVLDLTTVPRYPQFSDQRPTLSKIYLRRYRPGTTTESRESAECFYMTIMYACGDGESRSLFTAQDIGDVDGDGAPEFLDGWGRPIYFARWPAGFISGVQSVTAPNGTAAVDRVGDPESDHDPFDPFQKDLTAYRLVPLIYSAGPDGETIYVPGDAGVDYPSNQPSQIVNPYAVIYGNDENSRLVKLGTTGGASGIETGHSDDVTNHLQEGR